MRLTIFGDDCFCFLISQAFNALHGLEMEFHPDTFVVCIDKAVCMAAVAVHVSIRVGNTSGAHGNGYLMQCFGQ